MNQSLKDFMADNRRDFDDELPGLHNWSAVEKRLSQPAKKKNLFQYKWAAAIVLLFCSAAVMFMLLQKKPADSLPTAEAPTKAEFEEWPVEFAAKAKTYYETILERQEELNKLSKKEPELVNQFSGDLAALDTAYQVLQRQAAQAPGSDVIIKAMIQNLQLQSELLSRQLQIINQYSTQTKYSHEKGNSRSL